MPACICKRTSKEEKEKKRGMGRRERKSSVTQEFTLMIHEKKNLPRTKTCTKKGSDLPIAYLMIPRDHTVWSETQYLRT